VKAGGLDRGIRIALKDRAPPEKVLSGFELALDPLDRYPELGQEENAETI